MSRLTKREGNKVFLNSKIAPADCSKPKFCNNKGCVHNGNKRDCPMLRVIDKLADFEDKIDAGTLIEKQKSKKYIICTVDQKCLRIETSDVFDDYEAAFNHLSLCYDTMLKVTDTDVRDEYFDAERGKFKICYTNGEEYAYRIISV